MIPSSALFQNLALEWLNSYIPVSARKLNNIMKALTLATAILLPLSFLVEVYGLNFTNMPELGWKYDYLVLLGTMASIVMGTATLFRKKKWF